MPITRTIYRLALFTTLAAAVTTTKSAYAAETYEVPVPQAAVQQSLPPVQVAQACGWYVILGCSRSRSGARKTRAGRDGAPVLYTNDYPNFRNGWYCAYQGPYDRRSEAKIERNWWKRKQPDAYVKNGC